MTTVEPKPKQLHSVRILNKSETVQNQNKNQRKCLITFETQLKTALIIHCTKTFKRSDFLKSHKTKIPRFVVIGWNFVQRPDRLYQRMDSRVSLAPIIKEGCNGGFR